MSSCRATNAKTRFPPPSARAAGARKAATSKAEEDESFDDLPSVIPNFSDEEHAAILIWALLHVSGGSATRMDLARAFALRARPALLKKLAPASLKGEVAHWLSTVGSRSVKAGLLASTLSALAARSGVALGTNGEGRATVSASSQTPPEAQIDDWFLFEADLALNVLRAQPEEKLGAIDKAPQRRRRARPAPAVALPVDVTPDELARARADLGVADAPTPCAAGEVEREPDGVASQVHEDHGRS